MLEECNACIKEEKNTGVNCNFCYKFICIYHAFRYFDDKENEGPWYCENCKNAYLLLGKING